MKPRRVSSTSESSQVNFRINERGTHAELMARDGWYAEMYRQQQLATELEEKLDGKAGADV